MFVTWDNVMIAGTHVTDEQVTTLLTVLFDEAEAIGNAYPPLRALNLETAYKDYPGLEYHPAAIAFFEGRGVTQPPADCSHPLIAGRRGSAARLLVSGHQHGDR